MPPKRVPDRSAAPMLRALLDPPFRVPAAIGTFAQTRRAAHVILISVDGLRPDMYLDSSWPTPNLRYRMKQGTYAMHLKSVFPAYTYPSHTAMVTGALPARSGTPNSWPRAARPFSILLLSWMRGRRMIAKSKTGHTNFFLSGVPCFSRKSLGTRPFLFLKMRLKLVRLVKPHSCAISAMGAVVSISKREA